MGLNIFAGILCAIALAATICCGFVEKGYSFGKGKNKKEDKEETQEKIE